VIISRRQPDLIIWQVIEKAMQPNIGCQCRPRTSSPINTSSLRAAQAAATLPDHSKLEEATVISERVWLVAAIGRADVSALEYALSDELRWNIPGLVRAAQVRIIYTL